eukprot:9248-Heterococcus_DN1.PRE.2
MLAVPLSLVQLALFCREVFAALPNEQAARMCEGQNKRALQQSTVLLTAVAMRTRALIKLFTSRETA